MSVVEQFLTIFEDSLSDPLSYLQPSEELRARCLNGVKKLFDFHKRQATVTHLSVSTGPLDELYIEGFDNEQIWAEIELMNEPLIKGLKKHIKKLSARQQETQLTGKDRTKRTREPEVSDTVTEETDDFGARGDEFENNDEHDESSGHIMRVKGKRSVVDDKFFRLAEMEKFLEQSEQQEEKNTLSNSDSEDIDFFTAGNLNEDNANEHAHYDDFFDAPERELHTVETDNFIGSDAGGNTDGDDVGEDSDSGDEASEGSKASDHNEGHVSSEAVDGSGASEGSGVGEDELSDFSAVTDKNPLSTHEKEQLKMKKRIAKLEAVNLAPKSWQLAGEANAKDRPLNSLLAEDLSFDHMTRPAPVITEETTRTLEDIIKQRIIDEAWDDVERKIKPAEKPYDYSRSQPLDQEKSKLSLAEVYEQEYLKQTQAEEEAKEDPRHTEIKELMKKLFLKLDALSNFHFTPKPPKPEVRIVANVPAIQMEEVAPIAVSDAARLAPEELQPKSHKPEIGDTEKTDTDRKRDRRLKKRHKRLKIAEKKQREKMIVKLRPGLGNKYTRKSLDKKLKEREQDELVDKSLKSSSRFFAKLQEQVKEQVKSVKKNSSNKRTTSAQQFKL